MIRGIRRNCLVKSDSNNMMRFLSYLKPYRWRLVLSTVVGVLKYNLPVAFPWILKDVIDNLLVGKPSKTGLTFDQLMGLSAALFIVYAGITYLRSYIADRLAQAISSMCVKISSSICRSFRSTFFITTRQERFHLDCSQM